MSKIKKGDIVYNVYHEDKRLFQVKKIIKLHNRENVAILKGITERIELGSNISELVLAKREMVKEQLLKLDKKFCKLKTQK